MKFFIILSILRFDVSLINRFYISLIKDSHLHTIFFQSLHPGLYIRPINTILSPNLRLNNIQNCLIKFWCSYSFLTTKISLTFSWSRRISCHISIISNIGHTIIIWFFIPYSSLVIYIIKVLSIYQPKIIPKILSISSSHPIWSLHTIFTICSIQKSSYLITRYRIFTWKWNNI